MIAEGEDIDRLRAALERAEGELTATPSAAEYEISLARAYASNNGTQSFHRDDIGPIVAGLRRLIGRAEMAEIKNIPDAVTRSQALTARQNARRV
jgi:hypothetical protein